MRLANGGAFRGALATGARQARRGVSLRLSLPDFDRTNVQAAIENLLRPMADGYGECDLVIDLGTPTYVPIAIMVTIMQTLMARVPMLNQWRTVTIAGTSYPNSVANIAAPYQLLPRHEWQAYRAFIATIGHETRIPTFGDYASLLHTSPIPRDRTRSRMPSSACKKTRTR